MKPLYSSVPLGNKILFIVSGVDVYYKGALGTQQSGLYIEGCPDFDEGFHCNMFTWGWGEGGRNNLPKRNL